MLNENKLWESGSDSSTYSDYEFNHNSDNNAMVASTVLLTFTCGGKQKPKHNKGKHKVKSTPGMMTSLGVSKTPQQQQMQFNNVSSDKDSVLERSHDLVMEMVGMAFIIIMEGHFSKLYTKFHNLKMELLTLNTTVARIVGEIKKSGEVMENAPDPEIQPPAIPIIPKIDFMIRL